MKMSIKRVASPDSERFTLEDVESEINAICEWIKKEHHPHVALLIDGYGAQLLEVVEAADLEDFT